MFQRPCTDSSSSDSSESPPTSQQLAVRESATSGSKEVLKQLKQTCGHCCTGERHRKGEYFLYIILVLGLKGDLHPGTAWLKCGEKGCRSKNFAFHAICHGVRVSKHDVKAFCEKFIRCSSHVKQNINFSAIANEFETSSDTDSDEVFMTSKKRKKSTQTRNVRNPVQVATPGAYSLQTNSRRQTRTENSNHLNTLVLDDSASDTPDRGASTSRSALGRKLISKQLNNGSSAEKSKPQFSGYKRPSIVSS